MCLTCLAFDLEDNNIENGSLIRKDFKLAGVHHYKKPEMSPMDVLNAILTLQLMTAFLVQVLVSEHNARHQYVANVDLALLLSW